AVSLGPVENGRSKTPSERPSESSADIRAQGWVSFDRDYDLQISSKPIDLSVIKALEETELAGHLRLEAEGAGSFSDPRAQGSLDFAGLTVAGRALPDIQIAADLQDHILAFRSAAPASVKGRFDLLSRDFTASARLSEADLAPFFEMAGRSALSGRISANLEAAGNAENPGGIRGRLHIESLFVRRNTIELMRTSDFKARLADGRLTLAENRLRFLEKGEVQLDGYADWAAALPAGGRESGKLHLDARGRIPAGVAGALVPGIDNPVGAVDLDARVRGAVSRPEVLADIVFDDLGCTISETLQKLHQVNGRIRITEAAVTISKLDGRLDGGQFSLEGRVRLDRFKPGQADLSLSARTLPVIVPEVMEAQINTDLKFSGSPSDSRLSGELLLLEGRYYKNFNLSLLSTARDIGRRRRETEPQKQDRELDVPYLKNLALDLFLSHRQPFVVDNNMAMMDVRPELRMQGTLNRPLVTGRAAVNEGTVTYRNTEFEVKKGVMDFVNPYRIEPTVNIEAEAAVRQWVITLEVSGPPDNLDLRLSSEPPEEDADILSLLAVGETTRELASGSGEARPPEEMLANLVAGRLEKRIKEGTGLDILELKYQENGSGEDAGNGVQVTAGKELSRRLTVKYGVERKSGIVVQQSTAIYNLLEHLAINAYQDSEGAFGGEMRYRLEFR
ncbi:MAG: translocation/assembly module TamB domain-containing protein, partial [Thermodesulfobacteriota bacterium]